MQDQLKVALVQSELIWENPEQNRLNFTEKIKTINEKIDLIVLPEMFTSGFTMTPEHVAETMNGPSIAWMKALAEETNAAICGSLVIEEDHKYYNRFVFVRPENDISIYDKRHTFNLAGEGEVYEAGTSKIIINYKGWKICPMVCYDLRFPVWARNVEGYDLLMYVANWPKPRTIAWDALLKARAIENMSYCLGVNRVGTDANHHEYSGHSAVYDVLGESLSHIESSKVQIEVFTLAKAHIKSIRDKLRFLEDRDVFNLE